MVAIVDNSTKVYIASQGKALCVLPVAPGVPVTRAITAGAGLTGGGDLSQDRTIGLDQASIDSLALADTATQPGDNISTLTNDAGYVDAAGAATAAPVQSVAGRTGTVTIQRADITDATAKGRDLLAIANDTALQAEIVARIAGATIAPAVVNATTHINAPSLRYGGTDILQRANTWTAEQQFRASGATGQNTLIDLRDNGLGASLLLRYAADAAGSVPDNVWYFRATGASRNVMFSQFDTNPALLIAVGSSSGPNISYRSFAIGATALAASERLRVAGGLVPGPPGATDCLFGGGVGRFGGEVTANYMALRTINFTAVGTLNDLDLQNTGFLNMTGASAQTVTGFAGGANGRQLYIYNNSVTDLTLNHQNTGSAAGNRLTLPSATSLVLPTGHGAVFVYYTPSLVWRCVSTTL